MRPLDLTEIHRSGKAARRDRLDFFDNPYLAPIPEGLPFDQWAYAHNAWASGWLAEDNGRDLDVQRFLRTLEVEARRTVWAPTVKPADPDAWAQMSA